MGVTPEAWPTDLRHTRDMWSALENKATIKPPEDAEYGDIVLTGRYWTMQDGSQLLVPAHISIKGDQGRTLQAQAADRAVVYREPHLRARVGRRMGAVSLDNLVEAAYCPIWHS